MDHLQAASLGATERYLLGTLEDDQRDAFEDHFFDCLECAEEIRIASAILVTAGATDAVIALPAPAVLPASSIQQQMVIAPREPAPVVSLADRRRPPRRFAAMAGGLAAAAALVLVSYQNLVVIPGLRDRAGQTESIQAVRGAFLTQTRSEVATLHVTAGDRVVALTLSRSGDRTFASYRCQLLDGSGQVIRTDVLAADPATDELQLLLPVKGLAAGSYVLSVEGVPGAAGGSAPPARYAFQLDRD